MNLSKLSDDDVRQALTELRQHRIEIDALKVKRDAVLAAITEIEQLRQTVNASLDRINEHLRQAL